MLLTTAIGPLLYQVSLRAPFSTPCSEIRLFADDCLCYREIMDKEDTLELQRDIDPLGNWSRKCGMRFQPVKCSIM